MAKMNALERAAFFAEKLEEQRHLLKTAVGAMAGGDLMQALHIATIIRTLAHETGSSKPLLKNLRNNYLELPILDRTIPPTHDSDAGRRTLTFYCPVSVKISDGKISLMTDLDAGAYGLSSLGAWWGTNPCMIIPGLGPVYRRELVLGLANKEGGAHVDADIPTRYQSVLDCKFLVIKMNESDLGPLRIARMVTGKSGVELLDCLDRSFSSAIAPVLQSPSA